MYRRRPTKTGGRAIRELNKIFTNFFPTKLFVAISAETGTPIITEKKSAIIDTFKERKIISYKSLSKEIINSNALRRISTRSFLTRRTHRV